jgi:hypothetical protein
MKKSILYSEADGNDLGYFITYHIMTMEKSYAIENVHCEKNSRKFFKQQFMKIPNVNDRMADPENFT